MAPIRHSRGPRPWSQSWGETIDLEHHAFSGPVSRRFGVESSSFLGGTDPLASKDTPKFLPGELDLFLFFEFLGQMVIVEAFVISLGIILRLVLRYCL